MVFTFWVLNLDPQPPVTVADGLYLSFYPCAAVALVLLLRQRVWHFHSSVILDGLLVALGVSAFGSLTIHATLAADGGLLGTIVDAAYPGGDLLLLALTLGLATLIGWDAGRAWWYMTAGCAMFAVADSIYQWEGNSYHSGTLLDAGWPTAMALLALAAHSPDLPRGDRFQGISLMILPSAVALTSIGFLVNASRSPVPFAGVVLAAAALVAVLGRGALTFHEVTQLAETRRQAQTDELTGLANRRRLHHQLEALLADPDCRSIAVVLMDLDRFKEVNDALGHGVGDELLRQLGRELSAVTRAGDLVARIGGDEFALVLRSGSDAAAATEMAGRILGALSRPFVLTDVTLHVDVSLGIALYPEHGRTPAELLRCADVAMYEAKRHRGGYSLYSAHSDRNNRDRLITIEQLRAAVADGQLVCYYQPKVRLATGEVVGAEALVRWEHPERGVVPPGVFLPLAEQTGLMNSIFTQVLDQALAQCRRWRACGHDIRVSVNLSATNLLDPGLPDTVGKLLVVNGLRSDCLELEITEEGLLADPRGASVVLDRLRRLGVGLSLDDYGTGYNTLVSLKTLPVDELKLDRTFITGVATDAKGRAIVEASTVLARSLGLTLVAEGVETEDDWAELVRLGVSLAQGYWISRPLPADQFASWLEGPWAATMPPDAFPATGAGPAASVVTG
jgi:diguanylate cyclase (GGDEF)-like protein